MQDVRALAAEVAWLMLVGMVMVAAMVRLADGCLRWSRLEPLTWIMVVAGPLIPYGVLVLTGLIPQAGTSVIRAVMVPAWMTGGLFAFHLGRRAVVRACADRQLTRILAERMSRITALHRKAAAADERERLLTQARTAVQRRRGRAALAAVDQVLQHLEPGAASTAEWTELRDKSSHWRQSFGV
ncbi:hypothetical protein [Streptomyces sp. NPDC059009]|uniref:hypothetical protein n=1 Tax=Streptomyces sp. NPDC059009 TaxID=3346694 RepID=UPI0036BC2FD2